MYINMDLKVHIYMYICMYMRLYIHAYKYIRVIIYTCVPCIHVNQYRTNRTGSQCQAPPLIVEYVK